MTSIRSVKIKCLLIAESHPNLRNRGISVEEVLLVDLIVVSTEKKAKIKVLSFANSGYIKYVRLIGDNCEEYYYRSKTYLFDEFLQKWMEKLKSSAQTHMGVRLTKDIDSFRFTLTSYKHSNGNELKVIKEWKESINSVKDSQSLLQSLKSSPFYTQFSDTTRIWEIRLADLDVYLTTMNDIQRKWIYLEPIFGRGALPAEATRFARVDSEFRAILSDISRDARLVSLCNRQSLKKSLEQIVDQLNRCQKALNQFLEVEKRSAFPRFYFLGDDDLLEILGQSTNPAVIQAHLKKLFQVCYVSTFSECSFEQNMLHLWLQQLSDEMRKTLKKLTTAAIREENLDPSNYPSQVLCLAEEVRFCRECEQLYVENCFSIFPFPEGNTAKLVHTPLTDKCYLTLTQDCTLCSFNANSNNPGRNKVKEWSLYSRDQQCMKYKRTKNLHKIKFTVFQHLKFLLKYCFSVFMFSLMMCFPLPIRRWLRDQLIIIIIFSNV
uniref:DHC_N2 domain-containing protein n=1 Tax=Heterorhabditis bacteriophora TaxID=37862 RepID=A0A1I7WK50_HETBA